MPYLGRAPVGVAGNVIDGDLKVTGTISGESINDKFSLDATDGSASNLNDHFVIEDGGTDGSATNAGDNLLLEDTTEAISGESINDNAITLAKLAGGTDGNIISFDASGDPVAIATGSDGQVLTSTGAGSPPAFEAADTGGFTLSAEVATTSGTSALFTGIGSNVKVIKIVFESVSFSGSNDEMEIQIGDAGGLETSGYLSMSSTGDNTGYSGTAGYAIGMAAEAADEHSGIIELVLKDATNNTWCLSGIIADDNQTADNYFSGGVKSLSATLDRVSFATENGRTLDGGSIAILTSE